ncbi:unnamed protein product [Brassica napus]|uniref:(rape) hypothetical protein n=1 Tax=Brassica napus TaxID=3708 RepID=A0A816XBQ1_BRANA|nr:unnamed protein product [Brassica napus]
MKTMELFSLSSILLLLVLSFTSPILSISDQPLLISSVVPDGEESCPYTVIVTTSCFSLICQGIRSHSLWVTLTATRWSHRD